jgi:hypothetical protein
VSDEKDRRASDVVLDALHAVDRLEEQLEMSEFYRELERNAACGWAWDFGARAFAEVKCYWCGDVLGRAGRDDAAIREHTIACAKRGAP